MDFQRSCARRGCGLRPRAERHHPETERGFRLRLAGVGDQRQLRTLLAGLLIGPESLGRLLGRRPADRAAS